MGKGRNRPHADGPRKQTDNRGAPVLTSEKLLKYYKLQGIVDDAELEQMFSSFRLPLPTTFRVTGSRANAEDVNEHIKATHVPFLSNVVWEGQKQAPPRQLPWYPGGLAWEFNVGKNVIRRSPEFKQFQVFLVHETDAGNLSRQEAVSMIPPLLLDVEPEHYVLDMCAAPGSKSAQLVEALHAKLDVEPTGFLLANDSDSKRCHMLVHQTLGRIGSPNMIVTNLDASQLPNMRTTISGDGTLRKNVDIWRRWGPNEANSLHSLQLRILLRGLQQLKPGGRLVYSTCSLNPVENEAVISAALRESKGAVSLIDISDRLPELKRRAGLTSWKVVDDSIMVVDVPEEGQKEKTHRGKPMAATLWPSGREEELNLPRCVRIYPHLQDTGGFFIAVLQKEGVLQPNGSVSSHAEVIADPTKAVDESTMPVDVKPQPVQTNASEGVDEASTEAVKAEPADAERPAKRQKLDNGEAAPKPEGGVGRDFKEDPYGYVPTDNADMQDALKYFGITKSFDPANLLVRNERGEPLRTVYHTSTSIRAVVQNNDYKRIRLVSCGAKLLARQDANKSGTYACRWRLMSDSVAFVRPHMTEERILQCNIGTLRKLMDHYVPHERFDEPRFLERLKTLGNGSALLEVEPSQDEQGAIVRTSMLVPIWQAPVSIQLMLDKKEKSALSCRIFGSDITTQSPMKKDAAKKDDSAAVSKAEKADNGDAVKEEPAEAAAPVEADKIDEDVIKKEDTVDA